MTNIHLHTRGMQMREANSLVVNKGSNHVRCLAHTKQGIEMLLATHYWSHSHGASARRCSQTSQQTAAAHLTTKNILLQFMEQATELFLCIFICLFTFAA